MMTTLLFVGENPKTNNSQKKKPSYQGTSLDLCEGIAAQIFH